MRRAVGRLGLSRLVPHRASGASETFAIAARHHRAGRLDEAAALYRKVIEAEPGNYKAHGNLGIALQGQGRLDQAVGHFQTAVALKPDHAGAYNNLGNALDNQGRLDDAVAAYRKAIALEPGYAEAHNNLGSALRHRGSYEEACACFRKAIEIRPDYIGAHYNHARVHKFVPGDPRIEELNALLKQRPRPGTERNRLLFALGKAHDDIGRYDEAFSYYAAANAEMAVSPPYDAAAHRREIAEIKDAFRDPPGAAAEGPDETGRVPIFVVGVSRSGKTLVESLLSQCDAVHGAGESREWIDAVAAVFEKHSIPRPWPDSRNLLTDDRLREIGGIYLEKIAATGSKLHINTSPGNYRFIGMILRGLPSARIIYCHRDPLDNCLAVYFSRYANRNKYSYDLANVASYHGCYGELMAHWQRLYGDRILAVGYEDLVRDPAEVGARMYRFCGLDDPAPLRHGFTTDEIGHSKHYEAYLDPVRRTLD